MNLLNFRHIYMPQAKRISPRVQAKQQNPVADREGIEPPQATSQAAYPKTNRQ